MRAYISGPMRGIRNFNYDTFNQVEEALYRWRGTLAGVEEFTVTNPAKNFAGDQTLDLATYMTRDLEQVLAADALILLPGWKDSEGAKLEVRVALATAKKFYEASAHQFAGSDPLTDPPRIEWTFAEISGPLDYEPAGNLGSPRASLLAEASRLITGDRNATYGEPTGDFKRSANAANAYGYTGPGGREIQPHDIAILISLVKISRLMWSPTNQDSWTDLAGYAACGYETTLKAAS